MTQKLSNDYPPKITPGLYYKPTGTVTIDGKCYRTVSLERDLEFKHMDKPSYVVRQLTRKDLINYELERIHREQQRNQKVY